MKKYQLHTKTEDMLNRFPALCKRLEGAERTPVMPGVPRVLCLGADLEKAGACLAVQCGLGEPLSLGTLTRESVLRLLPALRARGWRCVLGMEACGFGWRFQRELRDAGAEVLTFATEALTGRRKTNACDAAALARLVGDRTVHGNLKTSRIVREPSPEEQQPFGEAQGLEPVETAPLSEPAPRPAHRPARQDRGPRARPDARLRAARFSRMLVG